MTNPTRQLAHRLRTATGTITTDETHAAATTIDALLDAIEAGGMVQPRPAPVMDLGPLRELRAWHLRLSTTQLSLESRQWHRAQVDTLNQYFPEGDRL